VLFGYGSSVEFYKRRICPFHEFSEVSFLNEDMERENPETQERYTSMKRDDAALSGVERPEGRGIKPGSPLTWGNNKTNFIYIEIY
jgi:hypothetical protein